VGLGVGVYYSGQGICFFGSMCQVSIQPLAEGVSI
jgi:hypothetical protein